MPNYTPEQVASRIEWIIRAAEQCEDYAHTEMAQGYAEPGYADPTSGTIALANWNARTRWDHARNQSVVIGNTMPRVARLLEKLDVECQWEDEWAICSGCGKAVRTKPDCYQWQPSYWRNADGDVSCQDCVLADVSGYLAEFEGDANRCVAIDIDLEAQGYRLLEKGLEHGFHGGQRADPEIIANSLRDLGIGRFLFKLDFTGQFEIEFSVWVHHDEFQRIAPEKWAGAAKDGDDPAVKLQQALADAARKMPAGSDIHVAHCHADGTATVKSLTPEAFCNGEVS